MDVVLIVEKNFKILMLASVVFFVALAVITFLNNLSVTPSGELRAVVTENDNCYYKTVTEGDFVVQDQLALTGVIACTYDGDNNYDPFRKGNISSLAVPTAFYYDSCDPLNGNFTEYSCDDNVTSRATLGICTSGCASDGRVCNPGGENVTFTNNSSVFACQPIGDNFDPFKFGLIAIAYNSSPYQFGYDEFCGLNSIPANSSGLNEYSCTSDGKGAIFTFGNCTKGCKNGACIKISRTVRIC
ncbi:MAG: hypothetical protein L0196_07125 [candidate division Zixibacteria bacterium]|nr:hypothetical protein [candidate division Zixibacteria bacterium]